MVKRLAPQLLSWASILDEQTRAQAETASGMPFIHPHLALMPDAHLGKGATVGSVIPTLGAIIPAAVGVDIGCGRAAMVGIEYRDTAALVDEIPAAYKDIDQVMADAADLVEVRHTLHRLINVKGD